MAHLLGSKNCLDSLSQDILSMQECINGVLTNTGQLEHASWKYPTKKASSLDVIELLDDYSYCKSDDDSNRLSHIILFELVIDRFCLLLQSVSDMFDSVVTSANCEDVTIRPPSRTVTNTMSVGLVTKLFWNKICDVHLSFGSMEKEILDCNQSLMKLENTLLELKVENDKLKRSKSAKVRKKHLSESEEKSSTNNISADETNEILNDSLQNSENSNSVFTQTFETAFVPCEICSSMQSELIKVGSEIIRISESQGLTSSLSKQKKLLKNSQMSFTDISRWSAEEERELKKISQHFSSIQMQLDSVQKQLAEEQSARTKLSNDLNVVTAERDELKKIVDNLQVVNEKQCKSLLENNDYIETLEESNMKVNEENGLLNEANKKDSEELERYKQSSHALEQGMNSLNAQLELQKDVNEKLVSAQQELAEIQTKLKETEGKLNEANTKHEKVKAENKVLLKHDQSLQTKQANLLSKIDKLDETCENLVVQLGENEEEVEKLTDDNMKKDVEIEKLRNELQNQTEATNKLQMQVNNSGNTSGGGHDEAYHSERNTLLNEVESLKHDLRLVVCYPVIGANYAKHEDLYKAIVNNPQNQLHSDTDVIVDMENQINANSARIGVLTTQNQSFQNSLGKLEQANIDVRNKEMLIQPSTVTQNYAKESTRTYQSHSATERTIPPKDSFVVPRPPSEPRTSSKLSRPWSGKKETKKESFNIGATLANLDRLKNTTVVKKFDWNSADANNVAKTAWGEGNAEGVEGDEEDVEETIYQEEKSFICPDCDKTYLSDRDLDIHKNFCYGRLK